MRKRGLCCRPVSVRLSVRPSVTFVYSIQTAENIVKLLSRPGSPISAGTQFQMETPSAGTQNTPGQEKFAIFD